MSQIGNILRHLRLVVWHCSYFVEILMMFRPNFSLESVTISNVPLIGISSHFLNNDELIKARVCFTQLMLISDIVRSQRNFYIRNFEYSSILSLRWRGNFSAVSNVLCTFRLMIFFKLAHPYRNQRHFLDTWDPHSFSQMVLLHHCWLTHRDTE